MDTSATNKEIDDLKDGAGKLQRRVDRIVYAGKREGEISENADLYIALFHSKSNSAIETEVGEDIEIELAGAEEDDDYELYKMEGYTCIWAAGAHFGTLQYVGDHGQFDIQSIEKCAEKCNDYGKCLAIDHKYYQGVQTCRLFKKHEPRVGEEGRRYCYKDYAELEEFEDDQAVAEEGEASIGHYTGEKYKRKLSPSKCNGEFAWNETNIKSRWGTDFTKRNALKACTVSKQEPEGYKSYRGKIYFCCKTKRFAAIETELGREVPKLQNEFKKIKEGKIKCSESVQICGGRSTRKTCTLEECVQLCDAKSDCKVMFSFKNKYCFSSSTCNLVPARFSGLLAEKVGPASTKIETQVADAESNVGYILFGNNAESTEKPIHLGYRKLPKAIETELGEVPKLQNEFKKIKEGKIKCSESVQICGGRSTRKTCTLKECVQLCDAKSDCKVMFSFKNKYCFSSLTCNLVPAPFSGLLAEKVGPASNAESNVGYILFGNNAESTEKPIHLGYRKLPKDELATAASSYTSTSNMIHLGLVCILSASVGFGFSRYYGSRKEEVSYERL